VVRDQKTAKITFHHYKIFTVRHSHKNTDNGKQAKENADTAVTKIDCSSCFRTVAINTEFIAHLRLDSRITGYIIKVQ